MKSSSQIFPAKNRSPVIIYCEENFRFVEILGREPDHHKKSTYVDAHLIIQFSGLFNVSVLSKKKLIQSIPFVKHSLGTYRQKSNSSQNIKINPAIIIKYKEKA